MDDVRVDPNESRAAVEVPGTRVVPLDHDAERRGSLRDRVSLCVVEQPATYSPPLVPRHDEELLDDE